MNISGEISGFPSLGDMGVLWLASMDKCQRCPTYAAVYRKDPGDYSTPNATYVAELSLLMVSLASVTHGQPYIGISKWEILDINNL